MARTDHLLDRDPSLDNIKQMISDDIRNRLAFQELEHYQKHGRFLYKHPLLKDQKLIDELDQMRKTDPERFMNELVNADKSISRYQSQLKNKKYKNDEEKLAWQELIRQYKVKLGIMKRLIAR
jgi:hypothetical protein